MKKVFFSIESKVIRDTIEYVFIGKDKFQLRLVPGLSKGLPFVGCRTSLVVCECQYSDNVSLSEVIKKTNMFRKQLDKNIPLILFCENPVDLEGTIRDKSGPVRIVTLDQFFLDNLFNVMQEVLFTDNIACYM